MTAIVPLNIKTKKQLKEIIAARKPLVIKDPTPWGTRSIILNVNLTRPILIDGAYAPKGYSFTCTNHPKRSWFAEISLTSDGTIKVK